jgi:hypothetical protein
MTRGTVQQPHLLGRRKAAELYQRPQGLHMGNSLALMPVFSGRIALLSIAVLVACRGHGAQVHPHHMKSWIRDAAARASRKSGVRILGRAVGFNPAFACGRLRCSSQRLMHSYCAGTPESR